MRSDKPIDAEEAESCPVERALMYRHEGDPQFRDELRRSFMQECAAEAAARRSRGRVPDRGRMLRLPRITLPYAGIAAAAVIALAIGVGSFRPHSPAAPTPINEPMMFSQKDLAIPAPSARGFAPSTYGLTDSAELAAGGALDLAAREALTDIAQQSGGTVEFMDDAAEAHITVDRSLAEHVISTICERLGAQVSQPLSQAGSGQVTVVVRFSSN